MAATTQTGEQVSLKLLVNKETVLFAEAGKDFVDLLCSFLTLPLGTIARLVRKESSPGAGAVTVGCLNSLYQSVENLDEASLGKVLTKELLLKPRNTSEDYCRRLKLNIDDTPPTKYFMCTKFTTSNCNKLSTFRNQRCSCGNLLSREVSQEHFSQGFVNEGATIVITDNLTVLPTSMDYTTFALLQNLGVKSTHSLKEMTVNVTKEKVLDLLKCSLLSISKSTLTDTFLRKTPLLKMPRFLPCGIKSNSRIIPSRSIQINLKLVIRISDGKVLFAQGGKDFVELLLSFLTFPLGGVARVLAGNCSLGSTVDLGSVDELYKSIANLNEKYLTSKEVKNRLIDPRPALHPKLSNLILPIYEPRYRCYYQRSSFVESFNHNEVYITEEDKGNGRFVQMSFANPELSAAPEGVKVGATYIATDDLVITPASPISIVYLINRLGTPLTDLKEKSVTIGLKECLSILKASLTSTSALTNGLCHLITEAKEEKLETLSVLKTA